MNLSRLKLGTSILLKGHILNPLWHSRSERSRVRCAVTRDAVGKYLERYVPEFRDVRPDDGIAGEAREPERIFSIWLQGEKQAPSIVRACWRSMRANSERELVVLDAGNVLEWTDLPGYVVDKWRRGLIRPAHFADICRIDLLYRHGGFWLDATDFIVAELPEWIAAQDFFVFMSGEKVKGWYSYIQNCFIRGRKGNYLLKAWREAVLAYWKHENSVVDYFVHQLLFRKVTECNPLAGELFAKMPKVVQDPTHAVWFGHASEAFDEELFRNLTAAAAFQKTEYKSSNARDPLPGSFADVMQKMYL